MDKSITFEVGDVIVIHEEHFYVCFKCFTRWSGDSSDPPQCPTCDNKRETARD